MGKTFGYMVTWTTYGTWLQGDSRGYVKDGKICLRNRRLEQRNRESQTSDMVKLTNKQQSVVEKAILQEASELGQKSIFDSGLFESRAFGG